MGHPQSVVQQHKVHRLVGLLQGLGHHHAFASSQTVGLDHNRRTHAVYVIVRCLRVGKGVVGGSGNAVALHKRFRKSFGRLQLRRGARRAKNTQTMGTKLVHHPCSQWGLWSHHCEANVLGLSPSPKGLHLRNGHVDEMGITLRAAVAWRYVHALHIGRLGQFPSQSVFATAATYHQNLHVKSFLLERCVVEHILNIVQIFQCIQEFLHAHCIVSGQLNVIFGSERHLRHLRLKPCGI